MGKLKTKNELLDEACKFTFLCQKHAERCAQVRAELKEIRESGNLILEALEEQRRSGKGDAFVEFGDEQGAMYRVEISEGEEKVKVGKSEEKVIQWLKEHALADTCVATTEKLVMGSLAALRQNNPAAFKAAGLSTEVQNWLTIKHGGIAMPVYGK